MRKKRYFLTNKMRLYFVKFAMRLTAFGIMIWLYVRDKDKFYRYTVTKITDGINFMHIMWAVFMTLMILHIIPPKFISMGGGKKRRKNFRELPNYSKNDLLRFVHKENRKAWRSMIAWLGGLGLVGILYFLKILGDAEMMLMSGFYFVSDYICILIFCPFQLFGQKDRCCVNCRIYDWGHFMMFSPMIFVRSFYAQTLFIMSVVVIVHWEYMWTKYPERFWYGSNCTLNCVNCNDKTCTVKKEVTRRVKKVIKMK